MTRSQLIERLSLQYKSLTQEQITILVKVILDIIKEALVSGDKVEIRSFGSFRLRHRGRREGRNPKTGVTVKVPEKDVPFFKAGKELRALVDSHV
jgi:integration host factor subunit beta